MQIILCFQIKLLHLIDSLKHELHEEKSTVSGLSGADPAKLSAVWSQ